MREKKRSVLCAHVLSKKRGIPEMEFHIEPEIGIKHVDNGKTGHISNSFSPFGLNEGSFSLID